MDSKFAGAAAVGELVVFAPSEANAIGIYRTTNSTFASVSTGSLTMSYKFSGAAAVGGLVVFAPYNANAVGIYHAHARTFTSVTVGSLTMDRKFRGATAIGELVVFAPSEANVVGIYDTQTRAFDVSITTGPLSFSGAAAVGNLAVFAPSNADVVGLLHGRFITCAAKQCLKEGRREGGRGAKDGRQEGGRGAKEGTKERGWVGGRTEGYKGRKGMAGGARCRCEEERKGRKEKKVVKRSEGRMEGRRNPRLLSCVSF
jgi:hypothetical protein